MKQILITRDEKTGIVSFETVSIDPTETVFFTNLDPISPHWPTLTTNELGAAPSPNSSEVVVTNQVPVVPVVTYGCKIAKHEKEQGTINVFAQLASAKSTTLNPATRGTPIAEQQVVVGGLSPYTITNQQFQVTDSNNKVIQSGSGIGPELQLNAKTNNGGISVTGTPTLSGTYNFTFEVTDATGRDLQQVQYTMQVT